MRRSVPVLFAAVALLLLPGCVWLRLLDLKVQMQDFDHHLTVLQGPPLELRFRTPPLLAEDVVTLIGAEPSARAPMPGGAVWTYAFLRLDAAGEPALPVEAMMITAVVRDGRLVALAFPPQVSAVVPGALMEAGLRSLARARVDRATFSASSRVEADEPLPLPDRGRLVAVLGTPSRCEILADGGERLVYRYRLAGPRGADGQPVIGAMAFHFPPAALRPARFSVNLSGKWLYLDLPRG